MDIQHPQQEILQKLMDKASRPFVPYMNNIVVQLWDFDDQWTRLEHVRQIGIRRILFEPWSMNRLERCMNMIRQGHKPPPIYVTRYIVDAKRRYYTVADGNHRCAAAYLEGKKMISAYILSEVKCVLDDRIIFKRALCRDDGDSIRILHPGLSDEAIEVFQRLKEGKDVSSVDMGQIGGRAFVCE